VRCSLKERIIYDGTKSIINRVGYSEALPQVLGSKLDIIIIPRVVDVSMDKSKIEKYDKATGIITLFKETSDMIRCNGIVLDRSVLQSIDSDSLSEERLSWVNSIVEEVPIVFIEGKSNQIADITEELF